MKKLLLLFVLLSSITFYAQEKVYFTEHFKELPSAENAIYYTIYEDSPEGTLRTTYYLDNSLFSKDHFSNYKKRILNGTSERWYKNGAKEMLAIYVKGKQEGIQTRYFENGQIKRTENFKNGKFVDGKCFDENGTEIEFFPYYVKPEFPGGMKAFYDYVAKNFKSPNSSKGQIKIAFVVERDGTLSDFKIIEGINYDMNVEAVKVLFNSPKWIPGKVDGKDARVKFDLPITVK
ncbi:energy transducer TonB [Flavobacterium sinopsychrotolerans]|uniref:MORN repeat variant n=1 Tax=Flavobacterium sinopsychrotolerans TaxID=604089 RepID=A0A1H8MYD9_9FLAO|nr:energy transducer TonB [Flavobacterium sinopsychrotolerans]SEO22273.1 MORN repeat variant [Flavobacterium sinopsychrotolerans]